MKSKKLDINNWSVKSLLIILFFLLIGVIILWKFVLPNHKVEASWWNDGWNYRKAVSISNTSGSNLTDFQVSISIGTSALIASGKMQSDCDDIRVTDQNGDLIPFWIETTGTNSCNQIADTRIWTKASSLPTSGAAVYIYYGNPSAISASSGTNTFIYFKNNFQTSDLGWNWSNGGVENGWAKTWSNSYDSPGSTMAWIKNIIDITGQEVVVEFTVKLVKLSSTSHNTTNVLFNPTATTGLCANDSSSTLSNGSGNSVITFGDYSTWYGKVGLDATTGQGNNITNDTNYPLYQFNTNGWVRHVHKITNTSLILSGYSIGGLDSTSSPWNYTAKTITSGYTKPNNIILAIGEHTYDSTYMSEAFVRKYASIDPTATLQSEEAGGGPIAYWKFDEGVGTTAYDSTTNQNNGTISSATWQTEDRCISGKCLQFNGSNNYISMSTSSPELGTSDFTISLWAYFGDSTYQWQRLVGKKALAGIAAGYSIYYGGDTGKLMWSTANGSTANEYWTTQTFAKNTWHHIVMVRNSSDARVGYFYVDGKRYEITNVPSVLNVSSPTQNFSVGAINDGTLQFKGFIDEPKIYRYARTADQIKLDYNSRGSSKGTSANLGSAGNDNNLSNGLVGYWKMDEGTMGNGTTFTDSSGNGNTGTGVSSVAVSAGKFGNGVDIPGPGGSGVGSVINVNDSDSLDIGYTTPMTISFWLNADSTACGAIIKKSGLWEIYRCSANLTIRFDGYDQGSSFNLNNGQWYLVTMTRDPSTNTTKVYINGQQTDSWTYTIGTPNYSGGMGIGAYNGGSYAIDGKLDEVRIYNRTLSPAEVSQLYEYAPGPVGYWDFNEASSTVANDKSGNSNSGTLNSSSSWTQGKYGSAGNFNGTTDRTGILYSPLLAPTGSVTFSAWAYKNNWTSAESSRILSKTEGGGYTLLFSSSIIYAYAYRNGAYATPSTSTSGLSSGWHYFTGSYDGRYTKIYIDGILKNTDDAGANYPLTYAYNNALFIGAEADSNNDQTPDVNAFFNGKIDEVKIYNYARTQKQIVEDMNGNHPAVSANSAIAYYKFDEGYGTTTSNWGNGGTTLNGTFGTGSSAPTWTNDGRFSKALSFDGSDYVQLFNTTLDSIGASGDFTITTWNKQSSFSGVEVILGQGYGGAPGGHTYGRWQMGTNGSKGWISLYGGSSSPTYKQLTGTTNLSTNIWNQITAIFSRSEGKLKLYINGKYDSQLTWDGYIENVYTNRVVFGYNSGTNDQYMNGLIDETKIYNYALTSEEIKQDYNQGSALQMGQTNQTISGTTTSLDYCIPGDTSACASPVAEYKMDEGVGTTAYDTSGNNINAGFNSTPTWTQGKIGKSLNFNGTTNYLTNTRKVITGGLTFGVWIKTTSTDSTTTYDGNAAQNIIGDSTGGVALGFGVHGGKVRYQHYTSAWFNVLGSTSVNDGLWHYISVTHNSPTGAIVIYVDGKQDGSGTLAYNGSSAYDVIARGYGGDYFTGQLDQIRIYNYVRTPAQIAYDYNKGGPIGWWKFDECQGNIAYDWSGVGNTGTIIIGASGTQNSLGTCAVGTSAAWTNGTTGKINSSLNFDGTDDYVKLPNSSVFTSVNDFTVSSWVYRNSYTTGWGSTNIIPFGTSGEEFVLALHDHHIAFYSNQLSPTSKEGVTAVSQNTWHHVVFTRNGANWTAYLDGKIDGSGTWVNTQINISGTYRGIGGDSVGEYFNGNLDDVRVYNYALTTEQIKTLYNGGAVSFN